MFYLLWYLETNPRAREEEEERNRRIYEAFKNGPFEDIVARQEAQVIHTITTKIFIHKTQ